MKRRTKKLTQAILGIGALSTGAAVTTVAQACNLDDLIGTVDNETLESAFANVLNTMHSYNGSFSNNDISWNDPVSKIILNTTMQSLTSFLSDTVAQRDVHVVDIKAFSFDYSIDTENEFTAEISNINGSALLSDDRVVSIVPDGNASVSILNLSPENYRNASIQWSGIKFDIENPRDPSNGGDTPINPVDPVNPPDPGEFNDAKTSFSNAVSELTSYTFGEQISSEAATILQTFGNYSYKSVTKLNFSFVMRDGDPIGKTESWNGEENKTFYAEISDLTGVVVTYNNQSINTISTSSAGIGIAGFSSSNFWGAGWYGVIEGGEAPNDTAPLPGNPALVNNPYNPANGQMPISATKWGTGFAPFYDTAAWQSEWGYKNAWMGQGITNPLAFTQATGLKSFTTAFIQQDGQVSDRIHGSLAGLDNDQTEAGMDFFENAKGYMDYIKENDGHITLSFGGAGGSPIWVFAAEHGFSQADLNAEMNRIIDLYDVDALDFDIEGAHANPEFEGVEEGIKMLANSLVEIRNKKPNMKISMTLPVLGRGPNGNDKETLWVTGLQAANGLGWVDVFMDKLGPTFITNAMSMDGGDLGFAYYSNMEDGGAQFVIDSIAGDGNGDNGVKNQVKASAAKYGYTLTEAQAWALTGVTPMIGQNDTLPQRLYPDGWRKVVQFAKDKNMGMLSYWAGERDHYTGSTGPYNNIGIEGTKPFEYMAIAMGIA